jgi:hypothetical protein
MEGIMSVVYEIENRGKRSFIIGLKDHVSGGVVKEGPDNKPKNVYIGPDSIAKVTEECGKKLISGHKNEIRLIRKINRKE